MARSGRQIEEDQVPGAPEWMVTFSDCMTLLLTFFVLLLSFSSFNEDERIFRKLQMIFMEAFPAVGTSNKKKLDSVVPPEQIQITVDLLKGSEKPTLDQGLTDGLQTETPVDFRGRKVFSISSDKIFWGNGALMSEEGRSILTKLASFLESVPSRVVVCESSPSTYEVAQGIGLSRALAVIEFLTSGRNIDKNLFNVSAGNSFTQQAFTSDESEGTVYKSGRTLEIALLEWSR